MMGDEHFHTTLAYTKSPKTSRRTTFQEELESAVSARADRHKPPDSIGRFDDDDDDDEDDILNELLKTRKKKIDMFKTGRTKAKLNDFQLSDNEEENVRPKKVSFMKTKRKSSPVQDALAESRNTNPTSSAESTGSFPSYQGSNTPQSSQERPTPEQQDSAFTSQTQSHAAWNSRSESPLRRINQSESSLSRKSLSESPLPLNSENSQSEHPVLLLWEGSQLDEPLPSPSAKGADTHQMVGENGESPFPQPRERRSRQTFSRGFPEEEKPPRPVPRQRALPVGSSSHDEGDGLARASGSDCVQLQECEKEHNTLLQKTNMFSSSALQQGFEASDGSLQDPDGSALEQNKKEHGPTLYKEFQEGSSDSPHLTASRPSKITTNSQDSSRPGSSRKSKTASYTTESRYLGTLKVLDQKSTLEGTLPIAADCLRAAAYQDWLRKKQEKLQETLRVKKQEEKLKQDKKTEEEASKKLDAEASYEAWKVNKRSALRGKLREKQETLRKQQKEADEKEEKKETAKKVFEKWKLEHDDLLHERFRKQAQAKSRLREKKEKDQEERRRDCNSSFSQWSERKKEAILETAREERRKQVVKEAEEKYEKEEQEKSAMETYEKWLRRKDLLQKRERQEKKIRAIVQEEPSPPWSPPGRTVPFGK